MHQFKVILTSVLFFTSTVLLSQGIIISIPSGEVYKGIENYVAIVQENTSCKFLSLTVSHGKLTRYNDADRCSYFYYPDSIGHVIFEITNKKTKLHARYSYYVKEVPLPYALIGKNKGGLIQKAELQKTECLNAVFEIPNRIICGILPVVNDFSILVRRQDSIVYTENISGNLFTENTKAFFQTLKENDQILIFNINVKGSGSGIKRVAPIEYIVKE